MVSLVNPLEKLLIGAAALALAFAAGYGLRWHQDSLEEIKKVTIVKTVTVVQKEAVKVTDTAAVNRLQSALAIEKKRTADLIQRIEDQANATPAPATCRLPDRLRDALNDKLTTDRPGADAADQPPDSGSAHDG